MGIVLDLAATLFLGYFTMLVFCNRATFTTWPDMAMAFMWLSANLWGLTRLWVHA